VLNLKRWVKFLFIISFLFVYTSNSFYISSSIVSGKVLVIYGYPFFFTNDEYTIFRSTIINFFNIDNLLYVDDSKLKNYLDYMNTNEFLNLNDVHLIIFVSCRSKYFDCIVDFLRSALNLSVPVLFLPASTEEFNPVFTYFGFKLSVLDEFLFNFSSSAVVDHVVTRGVFTVGVEDRPVSHVWDLRWGNLEPVVYTDLPWRDGRVLAFVGEYLNGRLAGIAPQLYGNDCYDNLFLFNNLIRWLLGLPIETSDVESPSLKNFTDVRDQLLNEIESLKQERDKLLNETNRLKEEFGNLTNLLSELDYLRSRVEELESKLNATSPSELEVLINDLRDEISALRAELVNAYRFVGFAAAIGLVVGFLFSYVLQRRRMKSGG